MGGGICSGSGPPRSAACSIIGLVLAILASPREPASHCMPLKNLLISLAAPLLAASAMGQANVLIVVADDLGVDMLECYGEGQDLPSTPVIDGLAQGGLLFRNCWSNPMCSPTRATVQTGRFSFRTGIGHVINASSQDLLHTELILPEVLALQVGVSWACAAIGKWHLGQWGDVDHPNVAGYPHFSGSMHNLYGPGRFDWWTKVKNGVVSTCTTYATTDTVDEALAWIAKAPEPWFCYLAFNAPHDPFHAPPAGLHNVSLPNVDPRYEPRPFYKAAIEAMDTELGRLLTAIDQGSGPTNVIFFGDNGTPPEVPVLPFTREHAKMTVYEGGLNVPLLFKGPAVATPGAQCNALVNTTDLFMTVLDLAGARLPDGAEPQDSLSLLPYLSAPQTPSLREFVYGERFIPNGAGPYKKRRRAVREARYKLIITANDLTSRELYDLTVDRYELTNLLGPGAAPLGPNQARALQRLQDELDRLEGS